MEALENLILDFSVLIGPLSEQQLQMPWTWGSYKGEGVRFGIFRIQEELLELAARLGASRSTPLSEAQRILGQYHWAFRDLQGALWGVDDRTGVMQPGETEWPVQIALAHLVQADLAFYAVLAYAIERHAAGDQSPGSPQDADYDRLLDTTEEDFATIERMPVGALQFELLGNHERNLGAFAWVSDEMLDKPSRYWEEEPYSIRFRLHRLGSHLRQHTIQIDHTLAAIGKGPSQAKSLVRMLFNGLAEVENQAIGDSEIRDLAIGDREFGSGLVEDSAERIGKLADDIRLALEKSA